MNRPRRPNADKLFRALVATHRSRPDPVPGSDWLAVVLREVRGLRAAEADRRPRMPPMVRMAWRAALVMSVVALLLSAYALTPLGSVELGWPALLGEDSVDGMLALLVEP